MPRRSALQIALLAELHREAANSVTELAERVGRHRSSVSRSLALLREEGLVDRDDDAEWRLTGLGAKEATDNVPDRVAKSLSEAAAAIERARLPLRSIALAADVQRALQPLDGLTALTRDLDRELSAMAEFRKLALPDYTFQDLDLSMPEARRLAEQLSGAAMFDAGKHVTSIMQSLSAYSQLAGLRREIDSIDALGPALERIDESLNNYVQPFRELQSLVHEQVGTLRGSHFERLLADTALAAFPFHTLPWPAATGLLASLDDINEGATLSWKHEPGVTELDLGLMRRPAGRSDQPKLLIEVTVTCFLCGAPLVTEPTTFEWYSNKILDITVRTVPVCADCLVRESPNYLEMLAEALGKRSQRPHLELIKGSGEGSGRAERGNHLRLVERASDATDEEE